LDDALIDKVVAMVPGEISPITDMRATADYRTHITGVMLRRGLVAAVERLEGKGPDYGTRLI
jgi:carbon-monoxide dehydrogenase medium subunit